MSDSGSRPEMKAAGFNSSMQVARELVGAEAFERFVARLPPHLADYLHKPRLATNWIPFADAMDIDQRVLDELLHGDLERVFEIGRRQFKADLSTTYKVFVRLGSVSFIAKRTAVLYSTYTRNCGSMSVVRDEEKLIELEVVGHPFAGPVLWQYLRGNVHGAVEASGVRMVKTQIVESDVPQRRCRYRATWI